MVDICIFDIQNYQVYVLCMKMISLATISASFVNDVAAKFSTKVG